jgi:hypothetical protein
MFRVSLFPRLAGGAVVVAALAGVTQTALAADIYYDQPPARHTYAPPPPPVVQYEPQTYAPPRVHHLPPQRHVEIDPDGCRVTVRRYEDAYGRDVTRRTRDCGERDYSAIAPRPAYPLPHEQYRPYDANPRPVMPDADDFD